MSSLKVSRLDGSSAELSHDTVGAFADSLSGSLVTPGSPDYDEVRAIWNAMIDKRPGLIARCTDADDVSRAVRLAADHDLLMSIRGGGHNIAGNALCDGGLMIDLSEMTSVTVDAGAKTARVAPGATLGDVDRATQEHGLALPVGINSTTGIAGLTLGGGFGWLSRRWGLTIDSLLSADVVLASGERVRAAEDSHPDLFWALRGGGGNFGVVTSFEFRLNPLGPHVLAGMVVHPFDRAREMMRRYREFAVAAPRELAIWVVTRKAPPLPFLPEEVHGKEILIFPLLYTGEIAEGEALLRPFREMGEPIADVVGPVSFCEFEAGFDPLLAPGARNYWKSHNFDVLDDELIDTVLDFAGRLPTDASEIFIAHVGGAQKEVPQDATAYWHRDAEFVMNVHTRWDEAADDARCIAWAREFFEASSVHATGGVYVNFMPEDETERVSAAYGGNWERLARIKTKYDPQNRFRRNQNIPPAAE